MTKKFNKKILIIIIVIFVLGIVINRIKNGVKVIDSSLREKQDLYFKVTLNDETIHGQTDINRIYNLIPGILKVSKDGYSFSTYDKDNKYTNDRYVLIDTENTNSLILNLEVYKCYKNKFISDTCNRETKYFKKKNIVIDEVEVRRIGITSDKVNELVYKGKFGVDIYPYVKETDYYSVVFKYKDENKSYRMYYDFFTNILQPEVL